MFAKTKNENKNNEMVINLNKQVKDIKNVIKPK